MNKNFVEEKRKKNLSKTPEKMYFELDKINQIISKEPVNKVGLISKLRVHQLMKTVNSFKNRIVIIFMSY